MFSKLLLSFLLLPGLSLFDWTVSASFQKISMEMVMKVADGGYSSTTKATIYYSYDGKMVTYFSQPKEMVVTNNAKGEMQVYDPSKNTIIQKQNFTYSTETTQLYYFLQNRKNDLGLADLGFIQQNITFEEGLSITEWMPPMNMSSQLSKVKLVHERDNPIYMAYYDASNNIATKSYFYDYQELRPLLHFPLTITQINYKTPADSTINKTSYSGIVFDNQVDDSKFSFKIPDNAKVLH